MKFWATIEFLPGHHAAIVELQRVDGAVAWAGGFRVEIRQLSTETDTEARARIRVRGYYYAARAAALKGGDLDRFSDYKK